MRATRALVAGIAVAGLAVIVPTAAQGVNRNIAIVVHRGLHSNVGEDTLPSQSNAYDNGLCAETDVRYSSDHQFIQSHDPTGQRVFGHPDKIAKTKFATIRTWRTLKGGQQAPTATESFNLVREREGCLYMEIPQQWPQARLQQLENEARAADVLPYLHLYTGSKANLRWFHANAWDIGWKAFEDPRTNDLNDLHPAFVLVRPKWQSAATTNRLHAHGVLAGGGVASQAAMWRFMDRNDDIATTDSGLSAKTWRSSHP
jgi:glycerophosphoryl diester phosphodiesterase